MINLATFINNFNGLTYWKNEHLEYVGCNEREARFTGFQSPDDMLGLTDFDLQCDARESAKSFRQQDRQVLATGQSITILNIHTYADHFNHMFVTEKSAIKEDDNHNVGVMAVSTEITHTNIAKFLFASVLDDKHRYGNSVSLSKLLVAEYDQSLTEKDTEVIYWLLRGKTARETAVILHKSVRTIEHRLDKLKQKYNCPNKAALVAVCIENGFLNYLPRQLILY